MASEKCTCGAERRNNDAPVTMHSNLVIGKCSRSKWLQITVLEFIKIFYFDLDTPSYYCLRRRNEGLYLFIHRKKFYVSDACLFSDLFWHKFCRFLIIFRPDVCARQLIIWLEVSIMM